MLRAEANAEVLEQAVAERTATLASRNEELSRAIEQLQTARAEAEASGRRLVLIFWQRQS